MYEHLEELRNTLEETFDIASYFGRGKLSVDTDVGNFDIKYAPKYGFIVQFSGTEREFTEYTETSVEAASLIASTLQEEAVSVMEDDEDDDFLDFEDEESSYWD